ncbi:hypothetical protein A7K99_10820 [Tatumella citrea]|uniref:Flagellar protein FlhE n=1 Tax=Tatumella citrea TaxID=53336 RepID=A0A1Y0LJI7_TATCI|nr:hypothetical protein A7K98_10820 [Tatumella citrea]ARU98262.1 hypothetical protein A7K99_10820 [Tatumella citrea]
MNARQLILLLTALLSGPVSAADITVSDRVAGPAVTARGRWVATLPFRISLPLDARIINTGWFYQLTAAAPAGFQAQICRGRDCILTDAARGISRWFNDSHSGEVFYLRFRTESGAVIPPALRVSCAEIQVTYRQSRDRTAGQQSTLRAGTGSPVTSVRRY